MDPVEFVEVFSTRDLGEIALSKSILAEDGVPYHFQGEEFSHSGFGAEVAVLLVPADKAEHAKRLLRPVFEKDPATADVEAEALSRAAYAAGPAAPRDVPENPIDFTFAPSERTGGRATELSPLPIEKAMRRPSRGVFISGVFIGLILGVFGSKWLPLPSMFLRGPSPVSETTKEPDTAHHVYDGNRLIRTDWDDDHDGVVDRTDYYKADEVVRSTYDTNGDGSADHWYRFSDGMLTREELDYDFNRRIDATNYYEDGVCVKSKIDRDQDGLTDEWQYLDPSGQIGRQELDSNGDQQPDYFASFESGRLASYKADNDADGVIDEWGTFESGQVVERRSSFLNDDVIDRITKYEHGQKTEETFDRNRDGTMDERVLYEAFERVARVEKLRSPPP